MSVSQAFAGAERRWFVRYPLERHVTLLLGGRRVVAMTRNLSGNGMLLSMDIDGGWGLSMLHRLAVGTRLHLIISQPERTGGSSSISMVGLLVRIDPDFQAHTIELGIALQGHRSRIPF